MSSRWYRRFTLGSPQLRIFLPNYSLVLLKPRVPLPPNQVLFKVPVTMTKWDVKNYLEKIYNLPVVSVRTVVTCGELKKTPKYGTWVKAGDDYTKAYVTFPVEMVNFTFPNLFPDKALKEQTKEFKELEKNMEQRRIEEQRRNFDRDTVPGWFSV